MNKIPAYSRLTQILFKPVDASSLSLFRLLFGVLLYCFAFHELASNNVYIKYVQPDFFFHYALFDWLHIRTLTDKGFYLLMRLMGICAAYIALGILTRLALFVFFLCYSYTFLIEKAYYNNHYYLIILISLLLLTTGCNRWASFDGLRHKQTAAMPVPFWQVILLRLQISIVYFFAGLTKLGPDYLDGRQLRIWLGDQNLFPSLQLFISSEPVIMFAVYASLFIDLILPFLLWFHRTRLIAFTLAVVFHITNKFLFDIGIFHYFMIATLILFLDPDEPRLMWSKIKAGLFKTKPSPPLRSEYIPPRKNTKILTVSFLTVYLAVQCLVPLRHLLYKGDVNWTKEGRRFSWHLRPDVNSSLVTITVYDPEKNEKHAVVPFEHITGKQFDVMGGTPDMMLQYAHFLKELYQRDRIESPIIRMDVLTSLNGRPYAPFIDPEANLAEKEYRLFEPADWILPAPY